MFDEYTTETLLERCRKVLDMDWARSKRHSVKEYQELADAMVHELRARGVEFEEIFKKAG